jgi:nucleoside-triphosphatase THEP1
MAEQLTLLKNKGIRVKGFLCPGSLSEGRRSDFSLKNIHNGQELAMGSDTEKEGWIKYRRFYFNPEAFRLGSLWIKEALEEPADLLVIDEVGPMELDGMGWSEILDTLENKSGMDQLWIVRQGILAEVIRRWKISDQQVCTTESMASLFRTWKK